tara:strand:- start:2863 stop:4299 length:1437 start_codon:yes stop_codon:yes gene_type:complete
MHRSFYSLKLLTFGAVSCLAMACLSSKVIAEQNRPAPQEAESESAKDKVFNAQEFMLDNGMQVVVIPNHRAPVVTHMVWYKTGAAMEPAGKSGIAHYLEHLMFKGSDVIGAEALAPGEFSKTIRRLGGNDNAFTSQDYTAYFQSVPVSALEQVMRMEAGRMRGMNPPLEDVKSELSVIFEERRMRTDNDPQARFYEQLRAHSYINHPYGTPIIGWMHEVAGLSWEDAKSYYQKWYAPNNAILVVSGDVSPAEVLSKAIDIYGKIPAQDLDERQYLTSPPAESQARLIMKDKAVRESALYIMFRVPSAHQDKHKALALDVFRELMAGGPSAQLYRSIVSDQKLASSAGLSYDSTSWSDADITIYATPLPGVEIEVLEKALLDELRAVVEDGVEADDVENAITRLQEQAIYARDSLSGPAMIIGRALASGMSLNDVEYWPHDIQNVTATGIQNVVKEYLDPDTPHEQPPVTGILMPADKE